MHVVLYHPARLPVDGYGGTERVVVWLARGLAEMGHRVSLIAAPGSVVPEATLIPCDPAVSGRSGGPDLMPYLPSNVDVVHSHAPLRRPPTGIPYLWTLHGNLRHGRQPLPHAVAVSRDHARRHGISRWVHNGLDPAEYRFESRKERSDLFLGRMHSVKGWQWAVRGARRARRRIIMAGGWRPIFRPGVRWAGRVGGARKVELLARAACLWMPVQWEEPFGLTAIEAMVSGTPVLATPRGALPEIVAAGSGALAPTLDELVALRPSLDRLDPAEIRDNVLQRFTHRTMASRYLELYKAVRSEK
ncbi:MAG: glycosyltransferase [Gemmatimonadales bacterium]